MYHRQPTVEPARQHSCNLCASLYVTGEASCGTIAWRVCRDEQFAGTNSYQNEQCAQLSFTLSASFYLKFRVELELCNVDIYDFVMLTSFLQ